MLSLYKEIKVSWILKKINPLQTLFHQVTLFTMKRNTREKSPS